jgi:hypothetical protein
LFLLLAKFQPEKYDYNKCKGFFIEIKWPKFFTLGKQETQNLTHHLGHQFSRSSSSFSPDWHDDIPNNFQHELEQQHPMKAHSRRFLDH